jgi:hypothetical protein
MMVHVCWHVQAAMGLYTPAITSKHQPAIILPVQVHMHWAVVIQTVQALMALGPMHLPPSLTCTSRYGGCSACVEGLLVDADPNELYRPLHCIGQGGVRFDPSGWKHEGWQPWSHSYWGWLWWR